jgi:hypothetical protein
MPQWMIDALFVVATRYSSRYRGLSEFAAIPFLNALF